MTVTEGISALFSLVWRLFTSWQIPFIGLSPATFMISLIALGGIISVAKVILGYNISTIGLMRSNALRERKRQARAAENHKKFAKED